MQKRPASSPGACHLVQRADASGRGRSQL